MEPADVYKILKQAADDLGLEFRGREETGHHPEVGGLTVRLRSYNGWGARHNRVERIVVRAGYCLSHSSRYGAREISKVVNVTKKNGLPLEKVKAAITAMSRRKAEDTERRAKKAAGQQAALEQRHAVVDILEHDLEVCFDQAYSYDLDDVCIQVQADATITLMMHDVHPDQVKRITDAIRKVPKQP
jgi:homoserine acetyltransferase